MQRRDFLGQVAATAAVPLGVGPLIRLAGPVAPAVADGARVNGWLAQFDRIGRTPGGINRVAYSEADLAGRVFTLDLFRQAGLTPRIDAAGNIIGRIEGTDRALKPIVIGSHIDSVTDGGNFDGPLGSFGAIEVARTLREQGTRLRHPLEVVVWSNEEGGVIGSKLAVGDFKSVDLDGVARSGKTIREGIGLVGGNVAALERDVRAPGSAACYLELHIEQGGLLERAGLRVGVVQGIVGLRFFEVTVEGVANHAGATPMDQRHDAVLAAARFTVAINEAILSEPGRQVATVGRVVPTPNTRNVIAGRVELTVDLRDLDAGRLERFAERFKRIGSEIGAASGTTFAFREFTSSAPAMADAAMMQAVESSAATLGLSRQRMPSGAGHDAQEMAHICPMGMIFVPSVRGVSHSPKEFTKPEDVVNGVNVLLGAVKQVDAL
ncbi:MAG: Zn-dependent hydrolase [Gemmatimonadetes bacterium]|nr:Zn-dependent hydrolase [Gemmatimonadota bacterium]